MNEDLFCKCVIAILTMILFFFVIYPMVAVKSDAEIRQSRDAFLRDYRAWKCEDYRGWTPEEGAGND